MVSLLCLPLVDEGRDEVDAGLVCDHIARNQFPGHPEASETELGRAGLIIVVSYEILVEVLHVVDIQTHVVTESVRHEESGDSGFDHIVDIAPDDIQCTEFLQHQAHSPEMDLTVGDTRTGEFESEIVAVADNLVYFPLLPGELARCRISSGEVGSIVHIVLRSGIDYHQLARLNYLVVSMVVQCLAVLGENGREGWTPALAHCHAFHSADDFLLDDARHNASAAGCVHLEPESAGVVDLLNLALFFYKAH